MARTKKVSSQLRMTLERDHSPDAKNPADRLLTLMYENPEVKVVVCNILDHKFLYASAVRRDPATGLMTVPGPFHDVIVLCEGINDGLTTLEKK